MDLEKAQHEPRHFGSSMGGMRASVRSRRLSFDSSLAPHSNAAESGVSKVGRLVKKLGPDVMGFVGHLFSDNASAPESDRVSSYQTSQERAIGLALNGLRKRRRQHCCERTLSRERQISPSDTALHSYESFKFDGEESKIHFDRRMELTKWQKLHLSVTTNVLVVVIAISLGLIAAAIAIGATQLHESVIGTCERLMWGDVDRDSGERPSSGGMARAYLGFVCLNSAALLCAAALVYWAPGAAGSGLPALKAHLNGTYLGHRWSCWRTLVAKVAGITLVVGTALPLGKEGPMVHIGAMVSASVSRMRVPGTRSLLELRLPRYQREWVGMGAAAGVAAAFQAPLGGILYSFEEVCSSWSEVLTWRAFVCACVVSAFYAFLITHLPEHIHAEGFVFGLPQPNADAVHPPITQELFAYIVILSIAAGVAGGTYNNCVMGCRLFCRRMWSKRPTLKVAEVMLLGAIAFSLYFWLPTCFECLPCPPVGQDAIGDAISHGYAATGDANGDTANLETLDGGSASFETIGSRRLLSPSSDFANLAISACRGNSSKLRLLQFSCPSGSYNPASTLLLSGQEGMVKHLLSREAAGAAPFPFGVLLLVFFIYSALAVVMMGTAVPAGNFIPGIIIGGLLGRFFGEALVAAGAGGVPADAPGILALIGATACLGGMTRLTITIAAIMVEVTNDVQMLPSLMLSVAIAKATASFISPAFDDCMMCILRLPFLHEAPPTELHVLTAKDVMARPVITLPEIVTVGELVDMLGSCDHNGFPVVVEHGAAAYTAPLSPASEAERRMRTGSLASEGDKEQSPETPQKHCQHLLSAVRLNSRPVGFSGRSSCSARTSCSSRGRRDSATFGGQRGLVVGLVLRRQLFTLIRERVWDYQKCRQPLPACIIEKFIDSFATMTARSDQASDDICPGLSPEDAMEKLDLRPFMDPCPYAVGELMPLPRVYRLFNEIGVRHLPVMDRSMRLTGIITRKDVLPELVEQKLVQAPTRHQLARRFSRQGQPLFCRRRSAYEDEQDEEGESESGGRVGSEAGGGADGGGEDGGDVDGGDEGGVQQSNVTGGDADALRVKSSTDENCSSSVPPAITIHDHNPISEWPLGALDRFMSSTSRSRRPSRVMRSGPLTPIKTSPMSEGAHLMSDGPLGAFEQFMKIASRSRRPSRVHSGPQTPIKASDGCGTARAMSGAQWSTPSGAFCRTRRNSAPAVRLSEYARLRAPLCASCDAEEETLDTVSSII